MHYDIFISYRRATGKNFARIIKPELEKRGFSVFLDFDELKDGVFDKRIMDAIKESPIFLVILSKGALDRCANNDDWVRAEILYAKEQGKHIVPVEVDKSFRPIPETLPKDIRSILGAHQFASIDTENLFDVSIEKMIKENISPHVKSKRYLLYSWLQHHYKKIIFSTFFLCLFVLYLLSLSQTNLPSEVSKNMAVTDSLCYNSVWGNYLYTGPVDAEGKPHGRGKAFLQEPKGTYIGPFVHGVAEGDSALYRDKEVVFSGRYEQNLCKEGTCEFLNIENDEDIQKYVGTFVDGKIDIENGQSYNRNGEIITIN